MIEVSYSVDGSTCNTGRYATDTEKYRGNIVCIKCGKKAWFIKGYETDSEDGVDNEAQSTDIYVDLDKAREQSLYVAEDNDKHGTEESQAALPRNESHQLHSYLNYTFFRYVNCRTSPQALTYNREG